MITIISGTNRPNSMTEKVANQLYDIIKSEYDGDVDLVKLSEVDSAFIHPKMYIGDHQHPSLTELQDKSLVPSGKWIIISPEYNGSYSGIIKLFIDAVSVRKYSETFKGKKIALMGVASGRAGNLRGMDHLTTALNYLGMIVFPNRLPLPQISSKFDGDEFDKETWTLINDYAKQFIAF